METLFPKSQFLIETNKAEAKSSLLFVTVKQSD